MSHNGNRFWFLQCTIFMWFDGIILSYSSFDEMEITLDISTLHFISHFSIVSKIKYKTGYVIPSPSHRALVVP
jgi:hypothetical protein